MEQNNIESQEQQAIQRKETDQLDKSDDTINTAELTDLYNSSDNENANTQQIVAVQQKTQVKNVSFEIGKININLQIQELKKIIEDQKKQIDKLNFENGNQIKKIDNLNTILIRQNQDVREASFQLKDSQISPIKPSQTYSDANNTLVDEIIPKLSQQTSQKQDSAYSSQKSNKFVPNALSKRSKNTTDFWKENDNQFYSNKKKDSIQQSKQSVKLEDTKQDLWIEKEKDSSLQIIVKGGEIINSRQNRQSDLFNKPLIKKQSYQKSSNLKKYTKVFNEDLVQVESLIQQSNQQTQDYTNAKKIRGAARIMISSSVPQQESSLKKQKSTQQENQIIFKSMATPANLNKLEALKFKLNLQTRNLRLLKEHDTMMRDIEKKQSGGKRENKIQTMQTITRLNRELQTTTKQLKQELQNLMRNNSISEEQQTVQDCYMLMNEVDNYFVQVEKDNQDRLNRRNYKSVGSKINTNLKNVNQKQLMGVGSMGEAPRSHKQKQLSIQLNQQTDSEDEVNYQHFQIGNNQREISFQQQQDDELDEIDGDIGSSKNINMKDKGLILPQINKR